MIGGVFWQILGWVAFALNVWGNWALTSKSVRGWIIRILCNVCWIPYGFYTSAWALLGNHAVFIGINVYGWWKWRHDELHVETPLQKIPAREVARRKAFIDGYNAGRLAERRESKYK